ncbi:uncharacterized protein J4E87_002568 [Alternaria ethzedia]|uniref:uncharacterized protein n=1 Tax=Alternaria ethzedia TaxID=181014 RepID=UPI0020C29B3E|nr:uncharacterized protein J4E87_002568 [Alternaria ethzedia]KAI4631861.1 hypothetical protein J4E87_002568 [Alternaria ethzedia]
MKHTILSAVILLPLAYSRTAKELCRGTAELSSDGNWYCSEVWAITYRNISQPGAYNRTTTVDPKTGICGHERVDYPSAGPLTPLFGQVSMHLRGPMNVSQLAVYQLPGDARAMGKRTTVPFYNRRRSLEQPETPVATTMLTQSTSSGRPNLFNRDACTTSSSCVSTTVTKTVTVKAPCSPTGTAQSGPNTTYIGPPLPCLPTSGAQSISGSTLPDPNCTCVENEEPEPIFQRPNGQVYVSPTPTLKHAPETSSTQDTLPVSQHPDGQPFEVPRPSSSSPQDTLPVSQRPDGQLFDSPLPSPSSTQDILPVSQLPDGQPIQFPSPSPSSMQGILTVSQRPDGQPIVPSPSPSSPQETLPVSQRPDGQPFDIPSPSPSPPQDPLPVSQRPDGQPFDIPSPSPSPISKRQGSDWKRIAYYTSTSPAQATGLSFMANLGDPQKSGTFD